MQNKTKFVTIAILSSALFAAALAMSLTAHPAAGGGAGAICTKKGVCADNIGGTSTSNVPRSFAGSSSVLSSACTAHTSCGGGQGAHSGGGITTVGNTAGVACSGPSGASVGIPGGAGGTAGGGCGAGGIGVLP